MTTYSHREEVCSVCGVQCVVTDVASTSTFGSSDLDTRPPEMRRSTMSAWVQRCASCGYCAPRVSEALGVHEELLTSSAYRDQLADSSLPGLSNTFLCWSFVAESLDKPELAAWAAVHASWVCDDANNEQGARRCRDRAVQLIGVAETRGRQVMQEAGACHALLADLQRRCGKFDDAQVSVDQGLRVATDVLVQRILNFERRLISTEDRAPHNVSEAIDPAPTNITAPKSDPPFELKAPSSERVSCVQADSIRQEHATPNSVVEQGALGQWMSWSWGHLIPVSLFVALLILFLNLNEAWPLHGLLRLVLLVLILVLAPIPAYFGGKFAFDALAAITLKTPSQYRPVAHLLAAIVIAVIVPIMSEEEHFLLATMRYFETHSHFIYKLACWGIVVGFVLHALGKRSQLRPFPAFPLRWYVLLAATSFVLASAGSAREDELIPDWHLSFQAHYVGLIVTSYVAFWVSTWQFRAARGIAV